MKTGTPPILSLIKLIHSFEVNIRICRPRTVNMTIQLTSGLTKPDVNRKRMNQLFCYMILYVSLSLILYKVFSYL